MNHFKRYLIDNASDMHNYAHRSASTCDLSLITGQFIWQVEVDRALNRITSNILSHYSLPGENIDLLRAIAELEGVDTDCVLLTPGADVGIEIVLRQILGQGDSLGILIPTFPRFEIVAATLEGVSVTMFEKLDQISDGLKLVALCTPNNPTTDQITNVVLRALLELHHSTLFLIDGVFDWYSDYQLSVLCKEYSNLVLLKSFSKIGLAGLRLGYVIAPPDIISYLRIGQSPFSVPALVQAIGIEVINSIDKLSIIRQTMDARFAEIKGACGSAVHRLTPLPFYIVNTQQSATEVVNILAGEGISVVDGTLFKGFGSNYIRVAIGSFEQNMFFIKIGSRLGLF